MNDNIFFLLLISIGGLFVLVVSFVLIFIRNQHNLLRKQNQLQQLELTHQQSLLKSVIVSQEAERKRIGQDLHDSVGVALSSLRLTIEMFNKRAATNGADFSKICKQQIDKIVQDVRHISHNLSPPGLQLYGFMETLGELAEFITDTGKVEVTINDNTHSLTDTLGNDITLLLYRVLEELLNNTIKHAAATLVVITFNCAGDLLTISYNDNGKGIVDTNQTKKGMGSQNIESRLRIIGATYDIASAENTGFNMYISLKIPIA